MPAATSKSELLRVSTKEFEKLQAALAKVSEDLALTKEEDTSIKDVVAHRAHWIDLFLGWHRDGQADRPVHLPAPGYKWNDLKRYNADLRAAQADIGWEEAQSMLQASHARLLDFIEGLPDDALYGGPMKGGNSKWTTGRWAEAAGPSHYRSAAKYVRGRLRAAA